MPYVSGFDRRQMMFCSWDTLVDKQSIARVIDAFVNSLDMNEYGGESKKLKKAQERLEKYLGYLKLMEESGAS